MRCLGGRSRTSTAANVNYIGTVLQERPSAKPSWSDCNFAIARTMVFYKSQDIVYEGPDAVISKQVTKPKRS